MTNRIRLEIERTSGLQDVKAGDIVVQPKPYTQDWQTSVVDSVTPTRIRAFGQEWNKDNGRMRGANDWHKTDTIYCNDEPRYVRWRDDMRDMAEQCAELLHKLPASDLRQLAAKLGVKP